MAAKPKIIVLGLLTEKIPSSLIQYKQAFPEHHCVSVLAVSGKSSSGAYKREDEKNRNKGPMCGLVRGE